MTDIDKVLDERGKRYGEFCDHAALTQNLKGAMTAHPKYCLLTNDKKEAHEMIQHKVGRIINGDSNYKDSWTDIIGYTKLVEETL